MNQDNEITLVITTTTFTQFGQGGISTIVTYNLVMFNLSFWRSSRHIHTFPSYGTFLPSLKEIGQVA